jgi:hypothetical protein
VRQEAVENSGLDLLLPKMDLNPSPAPSLEEGLEETLAIHRLRSRGNSFKANFPPASFPLPADRSTGWWWSLPPREGERCLPVAVARSPPRAVSVRNEAEHAEASEEGPHPEDDRRVEKI